MQNQKRIISPTLYFSVLSGMTNLIFLLVGAVLLISPLFTSPLFKLDTAGYVILVLFLAWKAIIVGVAVRFSYNKSHNKEFLVKFTGSYLGRFFGTFFGAIIGGQISKLLNQENVIGFIVGALSFYFLGRWIGAKVSILIANEVDKFVCLPEWNKIVRDQHS